LILIGRDHDRLFAAGVARLRALERRVLDVKRSGLGLRAIAERLER
jgi:hypothetical protein